MTAEGYGKVMPSQKLKAIGEQLLLALLPRDDIKKCTKFTKEFKVTFGSKV